jgi:GNAT superfamily N-acetyltransferase
VDLLARKCGVRNFLSRRPEPPGKEYRLHGLGGCSASSLLRGTMSPDYRLVVLTAANADLLPTLARWSMTTVLETIPEFGGSADRARERFGNFSVEAMTDMFAKDLGRPDRRFIVVRGASGPVGHSILSVRPAEPVGTYGYCFTRFIDPAHRRRGLGGRLLDAGIDWFREQECRYTEAHTHATNEKLLALFQSRRFEVAERIEQPWPQVRLRLDLRT